MGDFKKQMFSAVCSKCGKDCQVPFRPTGSKPVFCSECFEKSDTRDNRDNRRSFDRPRFGGDRRPRFDQPRVNLDEVNAKLDKILGILQQAE